MNTQQQQFIQDAKKYIRTVSVHEAKCIVQELNQTLHEIFVLKEEIEACDDRFEERLEEIKKLVSVQDPTFVSSTHLRNIHEYVFKRITFPSGVFEGHEDLRLFYHCKPRSTTTLGWKQKVHELRNTLIKPSD